MACGEPATVAVVDGILAGCREPGFPQPQPVAPPADAFLEHAQLTMALSTLEVATIAETAAARFLDVHFGLEMQGNHAANERGIDHHLISQSGMLLVAETKGTRGFANDVQAANRAGRAERFDSLLTGGQVTRDWMNRDPGMRDSGLTSEAVSGVLGCRVDVVSQSIDVWEQNAAGGWDLVGAWDCPTHDLVSDL